MNSLNNIKRRQQLKREESYIQKLLAMLLKIFIISHFLGTIWHLVAYLEIQEGETQTWIQQQDLLDQPMIIRYINSFYQALAICLLIGSGGPTPIEQVCVIIFLFLTIGVFAYILSSISLIIEELNKKSHEYRHDMDLINTYMRHNQIEEKLQTKIRSYLEYVYQDREKMQQNINVKEVLNKLPKYLNDEIIQEINYKLLNKIHFLKSNFSKETLNKLSLTAQESNHVTNDIIMDQDILNKSINSSLFIIKHGKVDICFENQNNQIQQVSQLSEGSIFGDINFITDIKQNIIIKSSSFVTLMKIKKFDFIKILRQNQTDYEKYMYLRDQIISQGRTDLYTRQCGVCGSVYHYEQQCRLLCYQPYALISLLKQQRQDWQNQSRDRYYRPKRQCQKIFQNLSNLQCVSLKIQHNNQFTEYQEFYENYLLEHFTDINYDYNEEDYQHLSQDYQFNLSYNNLDQISNDSQENSQSSGYQPQSLDIIQSQQDNSSYYKENSSGNKFSALQNQMNQRKSTLLSQIQDDSLDSLQLYNSQQNIQNQILQQKIQIQRKEKEINKTIKINTTNDNLKSPINTSLLESQQKAEQQLRNSQEYANYNIKTNNKNNKLYSQNQSPIQRQISKKVTIQRNRNNMNSQNSRNLSYYQQYHNNNQYQRQLSNKNMSFVGRQQHSKLNLSLVPQQLYQSMYRSDSSRLSQQLNLQQVQLLQQQETQENKKSMDKPQIYIGFDMKERFTNYNIYYPQYNMHKVLSRIEKKQKFIIKQFKKKEIRNIRYSEFQVNKRKKYEERKSLYDIQMKHSHDSDME